MKPGRELDELVAEKVMRMYLDFRSGKWIEPPCDSTSPITGILKRIPPYSIDIAAAWEIVSKMEDLEFDFQISNDQIGWLAIFTRKHADGGTTAYKGSGETAPHAICLAALKAVDL